MSSPVQQIDSKFNETMDRLKVFAINTLTYDLRRFVYRITFKEVFKYATAAMFLLLIPTIVVLSVLASIYTGYLYIYSMGTVWEIWALMSVSGFLMAYAFYYFAKKFIFNRATRIIKLPEATNPAEIFVSRILLQLKNEQLKMINEYKSSE